MITGSSNFIGLVTAGFDNPFRSKLLAPLAHHLAIQGFMPLLMNADDPRQLEPQLRELLSYHVAGVILTSGAPPLVSRRVSRQKNPCHLDQSPDRTGRSGPGLQ